jgi:hypothetical protein
MSQEIPVETKAAIMRITEQAYKGDHFGVLGIDPTILVRPEHIKSAYHTLALLVHPDRLGGNTEAFAFLSASKDFLLGMTPEQLSAAAVQAIATRNKVTYNYYDFNAMIQNRNTHPRQVVTVPPPGGNVFPDMWSHGPVSTGRHRPATVTAEWVRPSVARPSPAAPPEIPPPMRNIPIDPLEFMRNMYSSCRLPPSLGPKLGRCPPAFHPAPKAPGVQKKVVPTQRHKQPQQKVFC